MQHRETEQSPLLRPSLLYEHGHDIVSGEHTCSVLSRLSFSWLNPLLSRGSKQTLRENDLYGLNKSDEASTISSKFSFKARTGTARELWRAFGTQWLKAAPLRLVYDVMHLVQPYALKEIIAYLEDANGESKQSRAMFWIIILFFAMSLQAILIQPYFMIVSRVGIHVRVALLNALYEKLLKIPLSSRRRKTAGEFVNLISVDCENIGPSLASDSHMIWSGPFQVIIGMCFLYYMLGSAAFVGISVILLLVPLTFYLGRKYETRSCALMEKRDVRIRILKNMLACIRPIKFNAYEHRYRQRVSAARASELGELKKLAFLDVYFWILWEFSPIAVAACCFTYLAIDKNSPSLTPSVAFPALAVIDLLSLPLSTFPDVLADVIAAGVSCRRISHFLQLPEVQNRCQDTSIGNDIAACLRGGNLFWDFDASSIEGRACAFSDQFVSIPKNKLTIVIGDVGSGKSSLLHALLGELCYLPLNDGLKSNVPVMNGERVALCSQIPFILSGTIFDNITFGSSGEFDAAHYSATIKACDLEQDLRTFKCYDQTEVGEAGVTLSGGQCARIAIARAVYSKADVIILDDVLSNIDALVGRAIFDKVIGSKGILSGQTRILVTHNVSLRSFADFVVCLDDRKIVRQELEDDVDQGASEVNLIEDDGNCTAENGFSEQARAITQIRKTSNITDETVEAGQIRTDEDYNAGQVSSAVYTAYFRLMGRPLLGVLVMTVVAEASSMAMDGWLSLWSDSKAHFRPHLSSGGFTAVYLSIAVLCLVSVALRQVFHILGSLNASDGIHEKMLSSLTKCPVSWFDQNPSGRILNRFSKGIQSLDQSIPLNMMLSLASLAEAFGSVLLVLGIVPKVLVVILPLILLCIQVGRTFLQSSRQLTRLERITKSIIVAQCSESARGLDVIRSFGEEKDLVDKFKKRIDRNTKPSMLNAAIRRWMSLRLEMLSALFVWFVGIAVVLLRGVMKAGIAGLVLSYALVLGANIYWLVLMLLTTEADMPSVERVMHYVNELPKEEATVGFEQNQTLKRQGWPHDGSITFRNVFMRYGPGLPLVLRNINLDIKGGSKLGVAARTGAGKSSLINVLFRIVEPEDGVVEIGGVDHKKISLDLLRTSMDVISQNYTVIGSSVREIVDPYHLHSDVAIWKAIEQCFMKNRILSLELGLDAPLSEGSGELSVGEKQLLLMARVLLQRSRIVVMDESSSALDNNAARRVQEAVREHLKDSTVIIIAHRLMETMIDCDTVIVMDEGRIVEGPAPPAVLLSDKKSRFYELSRKYSNDTDCC